MHFRRSSIARELLSEIVAGGKWRDRAYPHGDKRTGALSRCDPPEPPSVPRWV